MAIKQKKPNDIEWYKSEIRTLRKQNGELKREVKRYQKYLSGGKIEDKHDIEKETHLEEHFDYHIKPLIVEEAKKGSDLTYCPKCKQNSIKHIETIVKTISICTLCGERHTKQNSFVG